jgi:TonB family protein
MLRRIWPAVLLLSPVSVLATSPTVPKVQTGLEKRESRVFRALQRDSQFATVAHISPLPSCADIRPPEALMTPDPLVVPLERGGRVRISFIIGTDGRVHSPLIMESAGYAGDRRVLTTIRTWKYRPATCNGVPTETEGKVEFSSR